jgi:hypothetical protein
MRMYRWKTNIHIQWGVYSEDEHINQKGIVKGLFLNLLFQEGIEKNIYMYNIFLSQ